MKINEEQKQAIVLIAGRSFQSADLEVYTFAGKNKPTGSTDLDLLLVSQEAETLEMSKDRFVTQLQQSPKIGQRKIKLVFATPSDLHRDPFLGGIRATAVKL